MFPQSDPADLPADSQRYPIVAHRPYAEDRLQDILKGFGCTVELFCSYGDVIALGSATMSRLQGGGVDILHVPAGHKEAVDKTLITDMML